MTSEVDHSCNSCHFPDHIPTVKVRGLSRMALVLVRSVLNSEQGVNVDGGSDHLDTVQAIYIGLESVPLAEAMAVNKAIGSVRPRQKADLKIETFLFR